MISNYLFAKLAGIIANTEERQQFDAALVSAGKYLQVDRWSMYLKVDKSKKVMRLGTKNNYSVLSLKCGIIVSAK